MSLTTILSTDLLANSRTVINANFSSLADALLGASTLTTVTGIPTIASTGVLAASSNFTWTGQLLNIANSTAPILQLVNTGTNQGAAIYLKNANNDSWAFGPGLASPTSTALSFAEYSAGVFQSIPWSILKGGIMGIGRNNTNPSGTLEIFDATATSGITRFWVREGAGQTTSEAFGVYANDGTTKRFDVTNNIATFTSPVNIKNAIASTPTVSLGLTNPTAATVGAQKYSPAISFSGFGWGTTAGASQSINFRQYVVPAQGLTATGLLTIDSSLNGAAFGGTVTIDTGGNVTATGYTSLGNLTASATGAFRFGSTGARSKLSSNLDSQIVLQNNAGTDFSLLQFGGTTSSFPAIKRTTTVLGFRLADDSGDAPITVSTVQASAGAAGTPSFAVNPSFPGTGFYSNGNNIIANIQGTGTSLIVTGSGVNANGYGIANVTNSQAGGYAMGTPGVLAWALVTVNDTGLSRKTSTPGVVRFGNGTANDVSGSWEATNGTLSGTLTLATTSTPATSGATGTAGQIAWDSGFVYVCTAANTWKRSALTTW